MSRYLQGQAGARPYMHRVPPSTVMVCPEMNEEASEASSSASPARSSGFPRRWSGGTRAARSICFGLRTSLQRGVSIETGAMALTLMLWGPNSRATLDVKAMTAPLEPA